MCSICVHKSKNLKINIKIIGVQRPRIFFTLHSKLENLKSLHCCYIRHSWDNQQFFIDSKAILAASIDFHYHVSHLFSHLLQYFLIQAQKYYYQLIGNKSQLNAYQRKYIYRFSYWKMRSDFALKDTKDTINQRQELPGKDFKTKWTSVWFVRCQLPRLHVILVALSAWRFAVVKLVGNVCGELFYENNENGAFPCLEENKEWTFTILKWWLFRYCVWKLNRNHIKFNHVLN